MSDGRQWREPLAFLDVLEYVRCPIDMRPLRWVAEENVLLSSDGAPPIPGRRRHSVPVRAERVAGRQIRRHRHRQVVLRGNAVSQLRRSRRPREPADQGKARRLCATARRADPAPVAGAGGGVRHRSAVELPWHELGPHGDRRRPVPQLAAPGQVISRPVLDHECAVRSDEPVSAAVPGRHVRPRHIQRRAPPHERSERRIPVHRAQAQAGRPHHHRFVQLAGPAANPLAALVDRDLRRALGRARSPPARQPIEQRTLGCVVHGPVPASSRKQSFDGRGGRMVRRVPESSCCSPFLPSRARISPRTRNCSKNARRPSRLDYFVSELEMLLTGGRDGGLYMMIGRKR